MSKKILYGDLHLRMNDPLGIPTEDGLTTRIHQKIASLNKVIDLAIELKADEIIDLGDLFSYLNPPDKLRNIFARTVKRAIDNGIKFTRILGNHETDGVEGIGFDAGLLGSDLYSVVSTPMNMGSFVAIPEVRMKQIVEEVERDKNALIIGHFGVDGAIASSGKVLNGLFVSSFVYRPSPTFLGHIHKRQTICDDKVVYVGALCRNDFGDKDIPTGCCILDIDDDSDGKVNLVIYTFVEIPDISLHVVEIVEGKKKDESVDIELSEGDIVKVVYRGTYEWFSSKDAGKFQTLLKKLGAAKVMVQFDPISSTVDENIFDKQEDNLFDVVKKVAAKDGKNPEIGIGYLNRVFDAGKLES